MKNSIITILFVFCGLIATAQKAKLGTAFAQITESSMITGPREGGDPETYFTFKTTWKSTSAPETIFYKAATAWANCIVIKNGTDISPELIKKGSKVLFKTVSGGRFEIPKEIEGIKAPALFFKVKGKWYYLPVKNIKKKAA